MKEMSKMILLIPTKYLKHHVNGLPKMQDLRTGGGRGVSGGQKYWTSFVRLPLHTDRVGLGLYHYPVSKPALEWNNLK